MGELDVGLGAEFFGIHMGGAADAGRRVVELAGLGLGCRDQLSHVLDRAACTDHQHAGQRRQGCDTGKVAQCVVVQVGIQRRVDHVTGGDHQQGVAIGLTFSDLRSA